MSGPFHFADDSTTRFAEAPTDAVTFVSFDGGERARCTYQMPDRYRNWQALQRDTPIISRGSGLSYAPASFAAGGMTVGHAALNRVLGFYPCEQVVEVEAGITLDTLYDFLIPKRVYLPVQPGHGRITVGGCIAADIHGKNQARDGTFMKHVSELTIYHCDHGELTLSSRENRDVYELTCGGYGLTGHILRAKLKVSPTPAAGMTIRALPVRSCEEAINLLAAHSQDAEVLYSWHNATDIWQQFGKGYVFVGKWIQQLDHQPHHAITHCPELSATNRGCLPFNCWNRFSLSVVNAIHAWQCSRRQGSVTLPLKDALFPIHRKQLYFYLYGRKGFHEYQAIVPRAFASIYCDTIARFARRHSLTVPLLSIKSFCGKNELLRFSGNGMCIAVNLPRSEKALRMLRHLDEQLMQVGGQPNLIKDSRLPRDVVDACYPEADRFRRLLREYDRTRRYQSELSRRLSL